MKELLSKFEKLIAEGDRMFSRGDYSGAYESYLNALYSWQRLWCIGALACWFHPSGFQDFLAGSQSLRMRYGGTRGVLLAKKR